MALSNPMAIKLPAKVREQQKIQWYVCEYMFNVYTVTVISC